jgi:hypothetical protein
MVVFTTVLMLLMGLLIVEVNMEEVVEINMERVVVAL